MISMPPLQQSRAIVRLMGRVVVRVVDYCGQLLWADPADLVSSSSISSPTHLDFCEHPVHGPRRVGVIAMAGYTRASTDQWVYGALWCAHKASNRTAPHRTAPHHTTPHHTSPHHTTHHHTTHHITSHHITSHHHHTSPYHTAPQLESAWINSLP